MVFVTLIDIRLFISSVQSLRHVWLFITPWTTAHQASLSITNAQSLLKLMVINSVMPSNHLILCHSLLLLPSIFPTIRVFSNELALCIRWSKYWSFSFSISPSKEYSGLISFLLTSLISLQSKGLSDSLQLHSSKASVLRCAVFFKIHLSHPYIQLSSVAQSCPILCDPRDGNLPGSPVPGML